MQDKKLVSKNVQRIVQRAGIDLLAAAAMKLREVSAETMGVVMDAMKDKQIPSLPFAIVPEDVFRELQANARKVSLENDALRTVYERAVDVITSIRDGYPNADALVSLQKALIAVDPSRIVRPMIRHKKKSRKAGGR